MLLVLGFVSSRSQIMISKVGLEKPASHFRGVGKKGRAGEDFWGDPISLFPGKHGIVPVGGE